MSSYPAKWISRNKIIQINGNPPLRNDNVGWLSGLMDVQFPGWVVLLFDGFPCSRINGYPYIF